MSSVQSQSLDLTLRHDRYEAIDPLTTLKGSAAGKVVFISGASRGIGQATAIAFAEAGARAVHLTARSTKALVKTRNLVAAANPDTVCSLSTCDVANSDDVRTAVEECVSLHRALDIADANAGFLGPWAKIAESDPEGWWHNWEVNVRGAYHVARFTLPHLIESAKKHDAEGTSGGHLVLLSSVGAQFIMTGASDYQTSKHALNRLCEFVQSDHGGQGVKCFAIHPGGVATDLAKNMPEQMHEYLTDKPELAACFIVWLCSGNADWAAGRYLSANWDVTELSAIKDTIVGDDLLVNRLRARA